MSITKQIILKINSFGKSQTTNGFNRIAFSDADMQARRWLREFLWSNGIMSWMDPVGNVIGRWGPPEGPVVMTGSHMDTVAEGGAYDGTVGVAGLIFSFNASKKKAVLELW
ncbi:MAG: hypothetical protein HQ483_17680 [Rhodospirillales bacterium]|nr:hypothetical protein [Rhodospirillales bacterium]